MDEEALIEVDVIADHPDAGEPLRAGLASLARFAIASQGGGAEPWSVAILLTTDGRMRSMHLEFMGIDSTTDVMTFPADPEPGVWTRGGDIVISLDRAAEQGSEYGNGIDEEAAFLAVHGILHLCGWIDADEDDRARMLARQQEIVDAFASGTD